MIRNSIGRPTISAWFSSLAILATFGSFGPSAKAESPANWRVVSDEIRHSFRVPDGRVFTYGYSNIINPNDGRSGALFSLYKPGVAVTRFAIPADHLSELDPFQTKGWFELPGWLKKLVNGLKSLINAIKGLSEDVKNAYKAIAEIMNALGLDVADRIHSSLGSSNAAKVAVTIYLDGVRDAAYALPLEATLAERLAYCHETTIERLPSSQRRTVWYQYCLSIIDREGY